MGQLASHFGRKKLKSLFLIQHEHRLNVKKNTKEIWGKKRALKNYFGMKTSPDKVQNPETIKEKNWHILPLYIKSENFCISQNTRYKVKGKWQIGENICNIWPKKGIFTLYIKALMNEKMINPKEKQAMIMNGQFTEKEK